MIEREKANWTIYYNNIEHSWILVGVNDRKRWRINHQIFRTLWQPTQTLLVESKQAGDLLWFGEINASDLVKMQAIPICEDDEKPMFYDNEAIPHYDCTLPDAELESMAVYQQPEDKRTIQQQYLEEAAYEIHKARYGGKYLEKLEAREFSELPDNMKEEYSAWTLVVFKYLDAHGVEIPIQRPAITQRLTEGLEL